MNRLKNAWNVFKNKDPTEVYMNLGLSYGYRPDRIRFSRGHERSIVTSVCNRIAMDVATVDILHVKTDEDGRFIDTVNSGLNNCLTLEANIDQTGRAFRQDIVQSMLETGMRTGECMALTWDDVVWRRCTTKMDATTPMSCKHMTESRFPTKRCGIKFNAPVKKPAFRVWVSMCSDIRLRPTATTADATLRFCQNFWVMPMLRLPTTFTAISSEI